MIGRPPLHPDAAPVPVGALLARAVDRHGDHEAVVFHDRRLTYAEYVERIDRAAWGLARLGVTRGDHVAIWMENRPEWVIVQLAAMSLGAVVIGVNTRYTTEEAAYVLAQSDATVLVMVDRFLDIDFVARAMGLCPELGDMVPDGALSSTRFPKLRRVVCLGPRRAPGMLSFDVLGDAAPNPQALAAQRAAVTVDDVATIIYTSGTTAFPKGVMLTHGQIVRNMYEARVIQEELTSDDRLLVVAPFVHVVGGINSVFGMLHVGGCLVIMDRFTPEMAFVTLERERITRVYGPTTLFIDMLGYPARGRYDTSTLRQINIFPGPFAVEFLRDLMAGLQAQGVSGGYGLTETTNGAMFVCSWRDGLEKVAETVGRPRDQYELRIADPETGQPVAAGAPGEIRFRGFNVMRGYYGKPEETAKVIDADGWLHTGDLGMIDDEGYLRFLGRLKEMIKSAGFNVSCQEVEAVLMQHPAVLEAMLVGVPDARLTEAGVAYVRLRVGAACEVRELIELCRAHLARYKVPKAIRFVADFPLSASGKVQKFVLRDRFLAERPGG